MALAMELAFTGAAAKLASFGVTVGAAGWQATLTTKLGNLNQGITDWSYDWSRDVLFIRITGGLLGTSLVQQANRAALFQS